MHGLACIGLDLHTWMVPPLGDLGISSGKVSSCWQGEGQLNFPIICFLAIKGNTSHLAWRDAETLKTQGS